VKVKSVQVMSVAFKFSLDQDMSGQIRPGQVKGKSAQVMR